jgi:glycine/D-amino acid oxidase-like deaminating enzyme
MSMTFGVTIAGIATSLFIPDSASFQPQQMIHGIHKAFLLLGALTIASTVVFAGLRRGDGSAAVSPEETLHHSG